MSFAFFLISERLKGHSQFVKTIPKIEPNEVEATVQKNKLSVVFYLNDTVSLKPLFGSLYKYREQVTFFRTSENPGSNHYCISFPCISAYKNGKHVRSLINRAKTFNFEFWLKNSLLIEDHTITSFHEFSKTLNLPGNSYYSIGIRNRPLIVPPGAVHYNISKDIASQLGPHAEKIGTYFYRHADREFLKITRANDRSMYTPLFDIGSSDILSKPYLAVLFLNHESDDSDARKIEVLNRLAADFPREFHFAAVSGDAVGPLLSQGNFWGICGELFAVFKSNQLDEHRWALTDESKIYDLRMLKAFLSGIAAGTEPQIPASQAPIKLQKTHVIEILVNSDFSKRINASSSPAVVFVMSACQAFSPEEMGMFRACSRAFKKKGVRMFAFDQGRNDLPDGMPFFNHLPTIVLYPQAEDPVKAERKPVIMEEQFDVNSLYDFVQQNAGIGFNMTEKEIKELSGFIREEQRAIEAKRRSHESL